MGKLKLVPTVVALVVATIAASPLTWAAKQMQPGSELQSHLPKDPVLVFMMSSEDFAGSLDEFFETTERLSGGDSPADFRKSLSEWENRMGFSVRDDLLAQFGPEFALVIDLPSPEEVMSAVGNPTPEGWSGLLRGIGKIAQVRDAARLDDTLKKIFAVWEADIGEADGLTRVVFSMGETGATDAALPEIALYYGFRGKTFALGFSPDWVRASLDARPAGERLEDGDDFAKVAPHLDPRPTALFYLNLPKIADWIRRSPLISMAIAGDDEAKRMADVFLTDEYVGMGLGWTTIETDGGVRTTSFGPPGLSGGRMFRGIVAATAIPNFLAAVDRGKQKRTVADVRSIGTACDAYFVDNESYPGPTEDWVPVETIAGQVEPAYIGELPRRDGWGNPILYWSDGESYRVVSRGQDGAVDQDWSGPLEGHEITDPAQDIVFGNGVFLTWPQGTLD